jgi:1-acyl-sn-glycerol-3-phosphate acyltransferase
MERTKKDKRKDIFLKILIPFVKIWMFIDARVKREYIDFSRKTKEPYVMLGNHTFMFDVVHVPIPLKVTPFIVANQNLFTKQPLKFILKEIAHAIPKSKGASDLRTAKELITAVKKNYPILIFPEGDTTFNGETNYIEESTMKLIKKLKVDVVACKIQGGYLSKPRWARSVRKNRRIKITYKRIIKKEDLQNMSLEEISEIVNKELYNNDYEYQKEVMIPHPGKNKAQGIENVLYKCPECDENMSIVSNGDHIECTACKTVGKINDYGFIEGFRFDNIVQWDRYQKKKSHELIDCDFQSSGKLYHMNSIDQTRTLIGDITLRYKEQAFYITGATEMKVPFSEIKNPIITLRRNFNFGYKGESYMIKIDKYVASFLRVVQDKY